MKNKSPLVGIIALAIVMVLLIGAVAVHPAKQRLILATTTSTQDSGLLDHILPNFESKYDCIVDVIAVGSGQAMQIGKTGDADVLLVHSPASEKQFVKDGYGTSRTLVCYNQYVVIGPEADPAGVSQANNVTDAFNRIYQNGTEGKATFVSRGDLSGTDTKEKSIWVKAKLNVTTFSNSWYLSTGQGMGAVLDITEQQIDKGYTLSDQATYYTRKATGIIPHLEIVYQGDPFLYNQYSVIPVNPALWPNINATLAMDFVNWITSPEIQNMIADYTVGGRELFVPNAGPGSIAENQFIVSHYRAAATIRIE
ncbi:MAG: substrate-binding domain-containing protein [Methanomassiliicoccales archaeon]|nr:substrate-binding domain-containing protein [Methanomassiliicoccales archaeon]